ncbi:MAG: D-alanyl-D-alanine carboxypeptidase family protein, partial [Peptostreptococcaceae bacterium]
EKERRVIGVVLGANHKEKRKSAAISILDHAKKDFKSETVIEKDQLVGKKYIKHISELEVTLVAEEELYAVLNKEENLKSEVTFKEITYPVKKGDVLGVIKYYTDSGEIIGNINIVSANDVDHASFINKIKMLFVD